MSIHQGIQKRYSFCLRNAIIIFSDEDCQNGGVVNHDTAILIILLIITVPRKSLSSYLRTKNIFRLGHSGRQLCFFHELKV